MSFFKKIGQGFKKAFEAIGDVADKAIDGIGKAAGWVVDKVGDVAEGVTRVVAGDKVADKVKKTFDEKLEPSVERVVKGIVAITPLGLVGSVDDMVQKGLIDGFVSHTMDAVQDVAGGVVRLGGEKAEEKFDTFYDNKVQPTVGRVLTGIIAITPIGLLTSVDDIAQKGLIDGLVSHTMDAVQDVAGGVARLGGEKAEEKFDTFYDNKVQPMAEMVVGTVARIALTVVPGGQLVLAADAASEVASLGYRAANGEKLGVGDYIGAGASVLGAGAAGAVGAVVKNVGAKIASTAIGAAAINATTIAGTRIASTAIGSAVITATNVATATGKAVNSAVTNVANNVGLGLVKTGTNSALKETTESIAITTAKELTTETAEKSTASVLKEISQQSATEIAQDLATQKAMDLAYNKLAMMNAQSEAGGFANPVEGNNSTFSFVPNNADESVDYMNNDYDNNRVLIQV